MTAARALRRDAGARERPRSRLLCSCDRRGFDERNGDMAITNTGPDRLAQKQHPVPALDHQIPARSGFGRLNRPRRDLSSNTRR